MSECVVRMEMPNDKRCPFDFNLPKMGPWCWIEDKSCSYWKSNVRPSWCPIVCQLPEGHGRLVDSEAVESIIRKWFEEIKLNPDILLDGVKSLPTIVPAEIVPVIPDPLPIRGVEYVPTEVDVQTGTVKYEPRERIEL